MLYETLSQPLIILSIFCSGLLSALLFDLGNLVLYFCNRNRIVQQIIFFINIIISGLILYFINLSVNFGRFRIYILFVFFIAFVLWRFTIGKLWTKLLNKWYNGIKEIKKKISKSDERRKTK